MTDLPSFSWFSDIVAFEIGLVCILAILFLAFSLYFSLGPEHKFKELKKNKSVTWWVAFSMCFSLSIVLIIGNFLIFHFDWSHFLPATFLVSALVAAALKIGYYKTPSPQTENSRRSVAYENARRIQNDGEVQEALPRHEYPFTSPEETELAIKRWETS